MHGQCAVYSVVGVAGVWFIPTMCTVTGCTVAKNHFTLLDNMCDNLQQFMPNLLLVLCQPRDVWTVKMWSTLHTMLIFYSSSTTSSS